MSDTWTTIRYRDYRFGLVELTLSVDRHACLSCPGESAPRVFEGRLADWVFPGLCAYLQHAGLPSQGRGARRGGHALLSAAGESGVFQVWIDLTGEHPVALRSAVSLLEGLVSALSGGTLPAYKPLAQPVLASK